MSAPPLSAFADSASDDDLQDLDLPSLAPPSHVVSADTSALDTPHARFASASVAPRAPPAPVPLCAALEREWAHDAADHNALFVARQGGPKPECVDVGEIRHFLRSYCERGCEEGGGREESGRREGNGAVLGGVRKLNGGGRARNQQLPPVRNAK